MPCSGHWPLRQWRRIIKVGTIFPLSGGAGPDGQSVTNAVKLAVEQINEKGGLLGRKITLVSKDDESTPAVGVSRANEMIAEKVDVVIEGWNSPVTLAMQPMLARAGVLDITAVSKSDLILSGETNPLAIRINSSNGFDAAVIAKYVVDTLKAKKVAFLTQNDVYGNGFQAAVEAEFKKLNFSGEIMMTEKFAFKDTDFRVQLTNLKTANPDAIIVTNSSNSSGPAGHGRAISPGRPEIRFRRRGRHHAADGVQGRRRRQQRNRVGGHLFLEPAAVLGHPESNAFVAAFKKAYGVEPDKSAALGAAALQVWARAVEATKSLDRKTVAEAIRGKTIKGTVFGDATFLPNGQLQPRYVVFKVVDGKTAKLEPLPQN